MLKSLSNKVILSIIIVIFFGAFLSALIVVLTVQYQMSEKYSIEKEASIESLSLSLANDLDSGDFERIGRTIESALVYENIASVSVYDEAGNQVGSLSESGLSPEELEFSRHTLSTGGEVVGSFEIGFSSRYISDLVQRTVIALILVVTGFLLLVGLAFFAFIRHSILQPVRIFAEVVDKMDADNLTVRVDIESHDEIGYLAKAFNRMAGNLERSQAALRKSHDELEERVEQRTRGERRRTEQLRAINEVGRRISSFLSLDELLPFVVQALFETFNYYNVNIFLVEDDDNVLHLIAGAGGYEDTIPPNFSLDYGQGIVGTVAETEEYVVVPDVSEDTRYISSEELPNTRSELAVPLKLGEEILGVLDVQSDEVDAFDEIDVFTLQTVGDQLAVAIQNSRYHRETRELAIITERNRLAREIHDTLAQGFTGILVQLEAAEQTLGEDDESSQQHLERARQLARESLNEARRSVWALRPQVLENLSLADALKEQVRNFTQGSNVKVNLKTSLGEKGLSPDVENALLRIFQEALNNIRKHAAAYNVDVSLAYDDNTLVLSITDDGRGFETGRDMKDRFGLISMRERAKLLGGSFVVFSEPGKGTKLVVTIPVQGEK